ncbi:uncharacterized protein [Phaseolus vulgaris]|uniref:uncharacterized protein n=1 Tax=Phaseolus vulgaris TaxID=3885 RepID=UPI0035CABE49
MIGKYGAGYKPPSYHDIRENLLKKEIDKTDLVLQEYKEEWKKTDKVFKMLDDVVELVGEESVVQVVTDNAANLKVHELTIQKGRNITTYIYGRSMLISMLKKFTKERDLIRPGVTRFATAYLTLDCLHELKASLLTMFSSEEWKTSKFGTSQEGKKVANMILDNRFWKNISTCLEVAAPLMVVLRLVDSDAKPAMAAYYLNPQFHYEPEFRSDDPEVKEGLYTSMRRLVKDAAERRIINVQLVEYHFGRGAFAMDDAKESRKTILPGEWWEMFGYRTPELKRFAIQILSLTCSSSGCERNWSSFEMVHTKRRNRLHQKKMNDLVYVMYNLKLSNKQIRKTVALPFDDIQSDDEWITEEGDNIDEIDQVQDANVHLNPTITVPTLDASDLENLTFDVNVDEDEDEDGDDDEDDDGDDDGDDG